MSSVVLVLVETDRLTLRWAQGGPFLLISHGFPPSQQHRLQLSIPNLVVDPLAGRPSPMAPRSQCVLGKPANQITQLSSRFRLPDVPSQVI